MAESPLASMQPVYDRRRGLSFARAGWAAATKASETTMNAAVRRMTPSKCRLIVGLPSDASVANLSADRHARSAERGRRAGPSPFAVVGGLCAIVAAVAVVLLLVVDRGGKAPRPTAASLLLTAADLQARASAATAPVYWVGPRSATRYALELRADGSSLVRYLPNGKRETSDALLVVATYPSTTALADVKAAGRRQGSTTLALPNGGIATYEEGRPTNLFVAYPGVDAQFEVFDTSAARARAAVANQRLQPVSPESAAPARPFAATAGQLRALADSLRPDPVYWAGWRQGMKYEVTRTADGTVYVRYLPSGVAAGDPRTGLLTVATYPRPNALADVRAAAEREGAVTFAVPSGGRAVYDRASPSNVHLAYPGAGRQIEVYGSEGDDVASLVKDGLIVPVP